MVLKSGCNADAYLYNPDATVDWEDVFSLECFVEEEECCPICLMKHSVPRAARCGHIFCCACVMYYLRSRGDDWAKCPICGEYIDIPSLRPVKVLPPRPSPQEGAVFTMHLVARYRNVVNGFCADRDDLEQLLLHPLPYADAPEDEKSFCHLLRYSFQYEYDLLKQDLLELDQSETSMNMIGEVLFLNTLKTLRRTLRASLETLEPYLPKTPMSSSTSTKLLSFATHPLKEAEAGDLLFYYSHPTLLSFHLHPFNLKCLRSQYGDYCDLPMTVTSTVVQVEDAEVMMGKFRDPTLHHLPSSTPMNYVELDVKPLLIGRLDEKLWKEVKEREATRRRQQRHMKREERRIDVGD